MIASGFSQQKGVKVATRLEGTHRVLLSQRRACFRLFLPMLKRVPHFGFTLSTCPNLAQYEHAGFYEGRFNEGERKTSFATS